MLEGKGIHKSYGKLHVLKGVDIFLGKGEVVTLAGASGAGKSTLLQILGTLDFPDSGTVFFEGKNISGLSDKEQSHFRNRNLGFVFQFHHLLPEFNALENVCLPGWIAGTQKKETEKRAIDLLDFLKLKDRITHKPSELSGGEQQRVAVARALINHPACILADEPTGNLDSANSENLFQLISGLSQEFQVTFLITTHNEKLAAKGSRCLRIEDGLTISER